MNASLSNKRAIYIHGMLADYGLNPKKITAASRYSSATVDLFDGIYLIVGDIDQQIVYSTNQHLNVDNVDLTVNSIIKHLMQIKPNLKEYLCTQQK